MAHEPRLSTRVRQFIRSNILGVIAIYLALGGIAAGSHGAPDSISSEDIINGQVLTHDVGNNQIRSVDVRDDTLTGGGLTNSDIAADTLTGADIDESTLSGVPLTGAAGGDLAGTYPNPSIGSGAVDASEVLDNALTAADIADSSSLTGAEILESSLPVGGDLFGSVASASIGFGKVNTNTIADNTIHGADVNESTLAKVPSAANADFAANASTVDGINSTDLVVGRSDTADTGECSGNLPEAFETCADVPVSFPHAGRALVLATAGWEVTHFEDGQIQIPSYSTCQIQVDESTTLVEQNIGDDGADAHTSEQNQESVAMQALTAVLPAGAHAFEFNCRDWVTGADPPSDTDIDDAYLSVIVVGSG